MTLEEKIDLALKTAQEAKEEAEKGRLAAEKAQAFGEIVSVWAAHAYGYNAQRQREEIEKYWASEPEHDDIMYAHGESGFVGRDYVTKYYAGGNEIMNDKKLEIMSEVLPGVENTPEFYGIGDLVIRLQTTPYIVIADDCKTAKGIFWTLGFNSENTKEGKPKCDLMVGKDVVDFVKEADGWKIWHYRDSHDMGFGVPNSVLEGKSNMARTVAAAFPPANRVITPLVPGKKPHVMPEIDHELTMDEMPEGENGPFGPGINYYVASENPPLPERYATWSDDISYAKPWEGEL
jgi:hypothetical protein